MHRFPSSFLFIPLATALILTSCLPPPHWDSQPPRLVDAGVSVDGQELALDFDEPVAEAVTGGDFAPSPVRPAVLGTRVSVPLPKDLKPGKGYQWTAEVKDRGQNLTSLAGRFYGPNDHPAQLRLNEIRIAGSGTHPDLIELRVESAGSLGGWTVEVWSSPTAKQKKILPDVAVETGMFVVVHGKLTGDPAEQDEVTAPSGAGGPESDPAAWDFWLAEGKGFPATKGLVVLRPAPGLAPGDGMAYSVKPGEGVALAEAGGWSGGPELDPRACTATRTWCRTEDPDARWILVSNGGSTPGKPNRLTPWEGPTSTRKATPKTKGRTRRPRGVARRRERPSGPGSRSTKGPGATAPDRERP